MNKIKLPLAIALLVVGASVLIPADAQNFPTRPLRIISPYSPGNSVDLASRLLAPNMSQDLGQPIVVENRPGGGGVIAINELLAQPADGHTPLVPDAGHWAINPALQTMPYDFLRDMAPVGLIFTGPRYWMVSTSSPINTLQDLIALARAKPGVLNYGTPGSGTPHHMEAEVFRSSLGLDIKHIPYKGGSETTEALLRGDIQLTFLAMSTMLPHVKAGKMRMLAVDTKTRFRVTPDVPTVSEITGIADFHFPGQLGMVARAGAPKPVIERLSAALGKAALSPDVVSRMLNSGGLDMTPTTPEQFAELIREDIKKYALAVKISGAKPQ